MEKAKKCYGMSQSVFLITNPKPIIFLFTPNEIYCMDCIATTSLCRCVWSWLGQVQGSFQHYSALCVPKILTVYFCLNIKAVRSTSAAQFRIFRVQHFLQGFPIN